MIKKEATKADIRDFRNWLMGQHGEYNPQDSTNCLVCQYLRARGIVSFIRFLVGLKSSTTRMARMIVWGLGCPRRLLKSPTGQEMRGSNMILHMKMKTFTRSKQH